MMEFFSTSVLHRAATAAVISKLIESLCEFVCWFLNYKHHVGPVMVRTVVTIVLFLVFNLALAAYGVAPDEVVIKVDTSNTTVRAGKTYQNIMIERR
jgi:hypothetical protein